MNRDVSLAKGFALDFNYLVSPWYKPEKEVDPEWNLEEHLLKLNSTMKFVRLKQLFEVYLLNNFQED